ncbi:competence protein ComK [Bacillus sp. EB600]|nr:competence protein ComK [Bacillus sp. EB600]
MMMEDHYFINQFMMYMTGFYDRNGKTCTLVREVDGIFVVDKSPIEILEFSIKKVGFNLKGAIETSRSTLGDIHMCPIMVNPLRNIVVFPTQSAKRDDAMWFNPEHISRTYRSKCMDRKTTVEFKNGLTIKVASRLSSFNTKLQTAEQYGKMKIEAGKNPISFVLDPKKRGILLSSFLTIKCLTELLEVIF